MRAKIGDDFVHWTTRITIRKETQDAVRRQAQAQAHSVAAFIGNALQAATAPATAGSST